MLEWIALQGMREGRVTLLKTMILIAVLATAGAFARGIVSMTRGGRYDRRHSGWFMAARVVFQGLALLLVLIALLVGFLRSPG